VTGARGTASDTAQLFDSVAFDRALVQSRHARAIGADAGTIFVQMQKQPHEVVVD
jgi:hypothetical protein